MDIMDIRELKFNFEVMYGSKKESDSQGEEEIKKYLSQNEGVADLVFNNYLREVKTFEEEDLLRNPSMKNYYDSLVEKINFLKDFENGN